MSKSVVFLLPVTILSGLILTLAIPTEYEQVKIVSEKCRQFSIVSEELKEFYSPGYPKSYTNNLDCVLNITAEFGYQIRVDFRDHFSMEPSEKCENDFLEIRDGPHGYSDLIGKFCGKHFPPIITSKDRHLWLRFGTDDSLIYKGFRAVYEFIKNPGITRHEIPPCLFEQGGVQGLITDKNISEVRLNYSSQYSLPIDCTWKIEVTPGKRIYLFFESFKLQKPNECDQNYVDIFEGKRDMNSRLKHYCGSVADPIVTKKNLMYFRYYAIRATIKSEFTAYFTALRDMMKDGVDGNEVGECNRDEYDCEDATCIDASLECNGIRNCRHMYDEEGCVDANKAEFDISSQHIVIILTLGCGLLAGMCFAMCFNCIKKLVRDGKQIHENIRRSREQLEGRRSASLASFPKDKNTDEEENVACFIESKSNGHPCFHGDEDQETDEEDDDEIEDSEDQVEMRDCECQTRDTMIQINPNQRGTPPPPPPPPPLRRPPDVPPISPFTVPTPPPPPASHYSRHPNDSYHFSSQLPHHYQGNNTLHEKYRSETFIHMRDKPRAEYPKVGKTTPDVLVMH